MHSPALRAITIATVVVLFCAAAPASSAQSKKKASSKSATNAQVAAAKPETPFDDTIAKLPPAFAGNTVEWVLKNRTIPPKGEFETTAEYNERLEKFQSELYIFVPNEPESFDYDADAETFSAKIYPSVTDVHSRIGWYFRPFDVHRTTLSESTYVGSNAFGAKALVTKTKSKVTQVVVSETEDILRHSFDSINISFKLPRDRARSVKPNLRLAFICSPKAEQFEPATPSDAKGATGYDISEATLDSPTERWTYYVALRAELRQIWVFDRSTGEVFGRFFPNGTQIDAQIPLIQ
jgi:hypothetical protein